MRCIVDITLRGDDNTRRATEDIALRLMHIAHEQFAGILIAPPSSEGRIQLIAEKEILRIKFRIWPNRGQPIENAYYQELVAELQKTDPDYQPWMVVISYEVEGKNSGHDTRWSWRTRPKR